jgi:translation initiation factor eIF-2B subunit alpha
MAIIAKAANKPFYALAERFVLNTSSIWTTNEFVSYKFHRLFPLSQYDLPTHNPHILAFPRGAQRDTLNPKPLDSPSSGHTLSTGTGLSRCEESSASPSATTTMTPEQVSRNPDVDYTRSFCVLLHPFAIETHRGFSRPDLISLVFSDVGPLTPEGVSQYLVGMFAG